MVQRKKIFFAVIVGAAVIAAIVFIPTPYERTIREGTDVFEAHHALYGPRVKSVSDTAVSPITDIGLVLVNLRRASTLAPAHIRVVVDGKGEVAVSDAKVEESSDDMVTWFPVASGALQPGDRYTVEVSAPDAQPNAALGVRFDADDKQLALSVRERIPLWEYMGRWKTSYPDLAQRFSRTLFGGVFLAVLLWLVEKVPQRLQKRVWIICLIVLGCGTVALRIPLAASLESAYGGDAFNYLLKSRAWIDGDDPFAADPRKAPLYSLLSMPGLALPFDAVVWERWVSIVASVGICILVPLFLRAWGVPPSLALTGGVLIAVNREMQFESVQGLANTLYAFLVLAAAYLFFIGRPYMLAAAAALATLTRYEGGAVLAVLLPASYAIQKLPWRSIVKTWIPVGILLIIPFLMVPFSHSLGVRTIADIQGDEGLYVAYSLDDFSSNFISFKNFFGRLWLLTPHIGKPFAMLGLGILVGAAFTWRRIRSIPVHIFTPYLITLGVLVLVFQNISEHTDYLVGLFSFLAGMGIAAAFGMRWKQSLALALMIGIQIIAITAILPKTRYYLPIIPFVSMAMVGGVWVLGGASSSRKRVIGPLLCICTIAALSYADATDALPGQVSDYNEKSAGQTVLLQAARYLKHISGVTAVGEERDLQLITYLPKERVVTFPESMSDTTDQYEMLQNSHAAYVLETDENPYFATLIKKQPERFEEVSSFHTKWSKNTSTLYRVYYK